MKKMTILGNEKCALPQEMFSYGRSCFGGGDAVRHFTFFPSPKPALGDGERASENFY
jgi:hypothetical protein